MTGQVPEEPPPPAQKPTGTQMSKLHAGLRDLGVTDAADGLRLVSGWAGRPVTTTKELTRAEISTVLERLDAAIAVRAEEAAQDAEEHPPPPPDSEGEAP